MDRVPNSNRCYLAPGEVKALGLDEEYAQHLKRVARAREAEAERERSEKVIVDRKRIA
jgi:hypothetical protein